jgi:HAMP domain-containing protein
MKLTLKTLIPIGIVLFFGCGLIIYFSHAYLRSQLMEYFFLNMSDNAIKRSQQLLSNDDFASPGSPAAFLHFQNYFSAMTTSEVPSIIIWDKDRNIITSSGLDEEEKDEEMQEDKGKVAQVIADKIPLYLEHKTDEFSRLEQSPDVYAASYDNFEIYTPISSGSVIIGVSELHISDNFINQAIEHVLLKVSVFFFLVALAIFLLISVLLNYFVISPVENISEAALAIQNGVWDIPVGSGKKRNDEVASLASSFEYMREALRSNFEQLKAKKKAAEDTGREVAADNKLLQGERDFQEGVLRYLNSIGESVIATDLDGNITFLNLTAAKMIGWKKCSLVKGKKYSDEFVFVQKKENQAKFVDPISEVLSSYGDFALPQGCELNSPGRKIPVSGSFAAILKDGKALGVVGIFHESKDSDAPIE